MTQPFMIIYRGKDFEHQFRILTEDKLSDEKILSYDRYTSEDIKKVDLPFEVMQLYQNTKESAGTNDIEGMELLFTINVATPVWEKMVKTATNERSIVSLWNLASRNRQAMIENKHFLLVYEGDDGTQKCRLLSIKSLSEERVFDPPPKTGYVATPKEIGKHSFYVVDPIGGTPGNFDFYTGISLCLIHVPKKEVWQFFRDMSVPGCAEVFATIADTVTQTSSGNERSTELH